MREIDKRALGRRIREVRREAGLRQWELAQRLGTTQSAVHKYEHGVVPEAGKLLEIASLGRTSVEWLLTGRHGETGGTQRERPSDDAQRLAEEALRLEGPDRARVEEAIGLLRAAGAALEGAGDGAELLENARKVHAALVAHALGESARRLGDRGGLPESPGTKRRAQ
jgi:transcriptional regulator with XRE-family HTH domain